MRVSLLHNSHSGSKDHTADSIARTICSSGHELVGVAHSLEELASVLERDETELLAVAGGDGTVSHAACALAGSGIPLAILPHGTANNIALGLGIRGPVEEIVAGWQQAKRVPFDLMNVTTNGRTTCLAEAAGWGVFPQLIAEAKRREEAQGAERSLAAERALFRRVVESAAPHRYEVTIDGVDWSGDYLLVEISNVRFIGPQLLLAPDSSTADGLLEVTLWGESERELLLRLLDSNEATRATAIAPSARRSDCVRVGAADALRHVDGDLLKRRNAGPEAVCLSVRHAAVHYLVG
ncbi:MAG TPA: diacylglycerol kinase family protein [Polyangiaceae bacterium]|nr:diacylglycerol kinase family protein [Polyangiaceae bacterium]